MNVLDGTKDIYEEHKIYIQKEFKDKMGLIVDQPKQGGAGNSNDGNTARKFFSDEQKTAEITGIDVSLIRRFHVVLQTLSSGHIIDYDIYRSYAVETARLLTHKYSWYNMTPTVHKVLLHGAEIIENAPLPIGHLSEEASEATNKYIRMFCLFFTRKNSRENTMTDIFQRLLANSDPFIASLRYSFKKPLRTLSLETRDMLKAPNIDEEEIEIAQEEDDIFLMLR